MNKIIKGGIFIAFLIGFAAIIDTIANLVTITDWAYGSLDEIVEDKKLRKLSENNSSQIDEQLLEIQSMIDGAENICLSIDPTSLINKKLLLNIIKRNLIKTESNIEIQDSISGTKKLCFFEGSSFLSIDCLLRFSDESNNNNNSTKSVMLIFKIEVTDSKESNFSRLLEENFYGVGITKKEAEQIAIKKLSKFLNNKL